MTDLSNSFADHWSITTLRVIFGHALDTRDFGALDAIFTPDVDADLTQFGVPAARMPRADLVAIYRHAFRHDNVSTFQAYSNFQVRVDGSSANMVSLLHGHHAGQGFEGGGTLDLRARYHDRLVKTADGWRIKALRLEVIAVEGNMALIA